MFELKYLLVALGVSTLMGNFTSFAAGAAVGKSSANQRGGKAVEQMSTKGGLNTNAQWSADPDRGWIRADERHKLKEKAAPANGTKNNEHQKAKGKTKKS